MIPFKENERELRRTAADYSPDSAARIALDNQRYEVFFIPVLQATSHYEGKSYVSLINLNNGACVAAYPVSEKVTAGNRPSECGPENVRNYVRLCGAVL